MNKQTVMSKKRFGAVSIPANYAYACDELIGKGYVSREEVIRDAVRHLLAELEKK